MTPVCGRSEIAMVVAYGNGTHAHLVCSSAGAFMIVSGSLTPIDLSKDRVHAVVVGHVRPHGPVCEALLESRIERTAPQLDAELLHFSFLGYAPLCTSAVCPCNITIYGL